MRFLLSLVAHIACNATDHLGGPAIDKQNKRRNSAIFPQHHETRNLKELRPKDSLTERDKSIVPHDLTCPNCECCYLDDARTRMRQHQSASKRQCFHRRSMNIKDEEVLNGRLD